MNKFFLLLVFVVLASCSAVKSRPQKRQKVEPSNSYDPKFLRELKKLSQERLSKYDTRRKLSLLFDKYELSHSERRRLLFFDGLEGIDLTGLVESIGSIIGGIFGGEDGEDGGNDKNQKNKAGGAGEVEEEADEGTTLSVSPGTTITVVTTTEITTEESGSSETESTGGFFSGGNAGAAAVAPEKKQKGDGKRVRERRL